MSELDLKDRLVQLRGVLRMHGYQYYVKNEPLISDYEYDQLMAELTQIEKTHPEWITTDSPSQRAGTAPADKFNKISHPTPILSLANAFSNEDVWAWQERIAKIDDRVPTADYVVEPKFDGLTVILQYEQGVFVRGATRGDGLEGEDITANLMTIQSLPLRIPILPQGPQPPPYLVVRGEVFIYLEEFERLNRRLNKAGGKTYVNPRNTAAGSLRQLDPSITAQRPLSLLCYSIVAGDGGLPGTQYGSIQLLQRLGFPTPEIVHCQDLSETLEEADAYSHRRDRLPYEIDGMVIKINDLRLAADLGVVGKDPRGSIAIKFPAREVSTKLEDIRVNVGRSGVLTPYAVLAPVTLGGVTVSRATLHNFDFISEKDIRLGDRVMVKRAGDVIPYVIGPVTAARDGNEQIYEPPIDCPECGEAIKRIAGEVAWYCTNEDCPAKIIRKIEHFVSRSAMDIDGMGIKIVEQLVKEGLVADYADLFSLGENRELLISLEGFSDKKANNIIEAIDFSKVQSLNRLITGLGIRGVGSTIAATLANIYGSLENLSTVDEFTLEQIEGIGPNIASDIVTWFGNPGNQNILNKLKNAGVWPIEESNISVPDDKSPLAEKTFVITGSLQNSTRAEARTFIQAYGGKVTGSVSSKTDFLLVGEKPGTKLQKAKALGVHIISEDELRKLVENGLRYSNDRSQTGLF